LDEASNGAPCGDETSNDALYDKVDSQHEGTSKRETNMGAGDGTEDVETGSDVDLEESTGIGERVKEINGPPYNLRPNCGQSYGHQLGHIVDDSTNPKTYE